MKKPVSNNQAMKLKAVIVLAGLAAAAFGQTSARSEEGNELSRSGDDLSYAPARPIAASPQNAQPLAERLSLEARAFELRALRSKDESALVDGATNATPVIPASSLMASDEQRMALSPGGLQTGSGFAPINAARSTQSETSNALSRSAETASQFYGPAPLK